MGDPVRPWDGARLLRHLRTYYSNLLRRLLEPKLFPVVNVDWLRFTPGVIMGLLSALGLPALVAPRPGQSEASKQPHPKPPDRTSRGGSAGNATLVIDDFAFAKSDVPANHLRALEDLRRRLLAAPTSTVRLVGHTDTVGTEQNNLKLGLQRAAAVRALLTGPQ